MTDLLRLGRGPDPRRHGRCDARGRHLASADLRYEETGLIVTQENRRLIPDVELRVFDAKVREYNDLHADDKPNAS
jgi:hypothetical protein